MRALLTIALWAPAVSWGAAPAPAPAATSAAATDTLLDAIQAKYGKVSVLRGKFVQVSGSPLYGEDKQGGTIVLQRPGRCAGTSTTAGAT
ncbi:MAG: hypothetical protein R3F59_07395 [Myxococcota bacterium]